ncbi:MAG: alpha-L-rhamnosidase C-terminal domain-containing protein, partial [Hespellia sp.]|nr:alpha-L-rhamnosidase C-terminal domain-containing protein [Hespellia sp.]
MKKAHVRYLKKLALLVVLSGVFSFFPSVFVHAADWGNAKWIWQESEQSQNEDFTIEYDTNIENYASGFVFGADAESLNNGFLWQFIISSNRIIFKPQHYENGKSTSLGQVDISKVLSNPHQTFHVTIRRSGNKIETLINQKLIDTRTIGYDLIVGEIGFHEKIGQQTESAFFDNVCVYGNDNSLIRGEDFTCEWVYGGYLANDKLYLSGKDVFLASETNTHRAETWMNFRKSIELDTVPDSLTANIAVDSKYWLWINGELVIFEGSVKRGPTVNDTWYDTVDITPYLVQGKNEIAVLVNYYGISGFDHNSSGKGGFIFCAQSDGFQLVSDESWKAKRNNAYKAIVDLSLKPNYRLAEDNVNYDARDEISSWTDMGFNDSDWKQAVTLGNAGDQPWNSLYERTIPQWKNSGLIDYVNSSEYELYTQKATTKEVTIDMELPYNAQVTPYLEIEAPEGLEIKIQTDHFYAGSYAVDKSIRHSYITKEGVQSFEAYTWINGEHVYYTIPAGVRIISLKYRETGYDSNVAGSFTSNDSSLNTLWQQATRTLYVNMRDSFMDCPERERAAWTGDFTVDMGIMAYSMDTSSYALYEKCITAMANWAREDGVLETVVPGNYHTELPIQMLTGISGIYEYYMYSGNEEILESVYPALKNYLAIYQIGSDGLIVHRSGGWDWMDHGGNIDAKPIENAWYYMALKSMLNVANTIGKPEDISFYESRMNSIEANYNQKFWTGKSYYYSTSDGQPDDRANALAVLSGLADETKYTAITQVLIKQKYATPYMEKFVLDALCEMGQMEAAQTRIKARYAEMISTGSTLWEDWDRESGSSNHGWSGGPLITMSRDMAGISPETPGYENWFIQPDMGKLNQINCTVPTVNGSICVDMTKEEIEDAKQFNLNITSPDNTAGTVAIPVQNTEYAVIKVGDSVIYDKGSVSDEVEGVTYVSADEDYIYFSVVGGNYTFQSEEPKIPDVITNVYMQNIGWMSEVTSGKTAGVEGSGLRMEAIMIKS